MSLQGPVQMECIHIVRKKESQGVKHKLKRRKESSQQNSRLKRALRAN